MVAAILKWIMRKKSGRPGSWVDRLLGVRGWELISWELPNRAPPCGQIGVFPLLLWAKLSPSSAPRPVLWISPPGAGGPALPGVAPAPSPTHKPLLTALRAGLPSTVSAAESHTRETAQAEQPPAHVCRPGSVVFSARVSCPDAAKLPSVPSLHAASLVTCKTRRCLCLWAKAQARTPCPSPPSTALCCAKSLQSCLTLRFHGLQPARLFCPRASPGKNTGAGGPVLLSGLFPTGITPPSFVSPASVPPACDVR